VIIGPKYSHGSIQFKKEINPEKEYVDTLLSSVSLLPSQFLVGPINGEKRLEKGNKIFFLFLIRCCALWLLICTSIISVI